uniref:Uncharacterized protein n=1 Tax=viral metagenome TaxID=1070528 RepID=A0A6C0LCF0_9ZZZZ
MSSNKNAKTLQKQQANTIDEKHNELLEHFRDVEIRRIPEIDNEINSLKDQAKKLNEGQIEQYLDIRDKILFLRSELKLLKGEKKRYLLDNSKYIFHYFEQKQQISSGTLTTQNSNAVNSFFKIKSVTNEAANPQSDKYAQSKKAYQNYWRNVGSELPNIQNFIITSDLCEICNIGEMIPQDEEGILICNNQGCGKFITYIVDSSKPTNKEPPNEVSYTAYIRLNHFKEILSQFQAKETTQIPEEVINAIKARIKKERIKDMSLINYDKMRDILRKLGFNKYFEHIQYINSLFGIKPPIMNEELHETLCVLFIEIQKPWAVHCPANRTNFFNYTYTLHQLCVLLDQTQYLPYIPMMKDREKQLEQDMIWKKVCNDLDWEYFPSV